MGPVAYAIGAAVAWAPGGSDGGAAPQVTASPATIVGGASLASVCTARPVSAKPTPRMNTARS